MTRLTDNQITAAFNAVLGIPPRAADLAVPRIMGDLTAVGLAHYLHDHWLGEPDEPTLDQVEDAVREAAAEAE